MSDVIVSSSYHGKSAERYHTRECVSVQMMHGKNQMTEAEAKKRGLTECAHCAGDIQAENNTHDFSIYYAAKRAGENKG